MSGKPRKWWISGPLSLFFPGLGQIYNGQGAKGILLLIVCNLLIPFLALQILAVDPFGMSLISIGLFVMGPLFIILAVFVDAVFYSCRFRHEYHPKKYNKVVVYVAVVLGALLLTTTVPAFNLNAGKIKENYLEAFTIPSQSMEPTLLAGDYILVDRRLAARNPTRGDVIVFKFPKDTTKDFVKRVVAVGGDIVELRDKDLYLNNKLVNESMVVHHESDVIAAGINPRDNFGPITVPEGSFFVMGDNRDRAFDSRYWGFVASHQIKGTVSHIYWSWDRNASSVRWERIGRKLSNPKL